MRRQFAAALAVFVLALGAALWWRAHEVARSTHDAEFAVTEVRSIDELDPFAKALFGGLTGGVSEIVGKEQRVRPEGAALNAPNNPSAAHDPTPSVTPNATMPSTASPSTASPAAIPGLVPATRTKSAAPASMDGRSMDGSSGPNTSVQARLPLVERMASAPLTVAFKGQRHVLLAYTLAGVPQTLDYTEEVYADGLGHFAIDPLTLASPPMTTAEAQLFALTQKLREGFLYRMRDFNVRDAQLFLANYMLQDLAAGAVIAGRTCVELRATLQQNATSSFLIDVDPITALVMRVRETANDGTDLGTTEFISFTLNPDLTGALYHTDLPATPLDISPGTNTVPQIGFSVWAPQTVPSGYAFVSAENVDDGLGHHWARMTYGDGARQVFCLHTVLPPAMVGGGVPDGLQTAMWVGQRTAKVFRAGPWTIAQGFFGLNEFIAVGKCDKSLLLSMIKSAVH